VQNINLIVLTYIRMIDQNPGLVYILQYRRSRDSWIYNYIYSLCLLPPKLWVRIPLRCTRYNIMW